MKRVGGFLVCAFLTSTALADSRFLEAELLRYAKLPLHRLEMTENIHYCDGGGVPLLLDVVKKKTSAAKTELPAIIFIHDDLVSGSRKAEALALAKVAAVKNHVGITLDYRLAGNAASDQIAENDRLQVAARFPAPVLDVRCAIRFIRKKAAELGIHPGKIAVGGIGAGAYLALMAGLSGETTKMPKVGDLDADAKDTTNDVRAVINLGGVADSVVQYWFENSTRFKGSRQIASLMGTGPKGHESLYQVASPLNFIGESSAPVFSFHGTKDARFPYDAVVALDGAMKRAGVPHTLITLPHIGHEFKGRDGRVDAEAVARVLDRAFEFLEVSMKHEPTAILEAARKKREEEALKLENGGKGDDWW